MNKKMVFVGPAGAGKTTLRKIFFEYEIAEHLLDTPLDPTYGVESIVLRLGQNIGVFDLAGQENEKWLNGEDKEIFLDATIIIIVIEATSPILDIESFVKKVIQVRDETCHDALIYLLVHKIDLVTDDDLDNVKNLIINRLGKEPRMKIEFTSIDKKYFVKTLGIFKDIIKLSLDEEIILEQIDHEAMKIMLDILRLIKQKTSLLPVQIKETLNLTDSQTASALTFLESKNLIGRETSGDKNAIILDPALNPDFIEEIISNPQGEIAIIEDQYLQQAQPQEASIPPVLGFVMANKDGIAFLIVEVNDGAFEQFLGVKSKNDIQLVAPFVSALSHFSKELNVINMADFRVRGQNLSLSVVGVKDFQITLFINKDISFDKIKAKITGFFTNLIMNNKTRLGLDGRTGARGSFSDLEMFAQQWLAGLNKTYMDMVAGMKIFDANDARSLYNRLEDISLKIGNNIKAQEKLRMVKTRLVNAIMEKNISEIKEIVETTKQFETMLKKNVM